MQGKVVVGVDENESRLRRVARASRAHVGEATVLLRELQGRELAIFNTQLRVERESRGAIAHLERLGQASVTAADLCQDIESWSRTIAVDQRRDWTILGELAGMFPVPETVNVRRERVVRGEVEATADAGDVLGISHEEEV